MSRSMVFFFRGGQVHGGYEYKNSFGTGAMVWSALITRYEAALFPERRSSFSRPNFLMDSDTLFAKNEEIGMRDWETWVYLFMCDRAIARRDCFEELADALERFDDAHQRPNFVCHLRSIAGRLRQAVHDEGVQAAAIWCTSVTDNPWVESDEEVPYSFVEGDRHFFVEVEARRRREIVKRAESNCIQDGCENSPFGSVGGVGNRGDMGRAQVDRRERPRALPRGLPHGGARAVRRRLANVRVLVVTRDHDRRCVVTLIVEARKAARAVFLACDEEVAKDLSKKLNGLCDALERIDEIRNSIIGTQSINWSAHVYPLVEILGNIGLEGEGYDKARGKAATLIEQRDEAIELLGVIASDYADPNEEAVKRARELVELHNKAPRDRARWVEVFDKSKGERFEDLVDLLDLDDSCGGGDALCGGCGQCLLTQAEQSDGLMFRRWTEREMIERMRKRVVDAALEHMKTSTSSSGTALVLDNALRGLDNVKKKARRS